MTTEKTFRARVATSLGKEVDRREIVGGESKDLESKISLVRIAIYLALGILGAWFVFRPNDEPTAYDVGLSFVGFWMFFFSITALLAHVIRALEPKPTIQDTADWEFERSEGKNHYVRSFIRKWTLPSFAVILALASHHLWIEGFPIGGVVFVIFLLAIVFASLIGISRMLWDYNERRHEALMNTGPSENRKSK